MRFILLAFLFSVISCTSPTKNTDPERDAMIDAGGPTEQWQGIENKEEARLVIRKNLHHIRKCYQIQLRNDVSAEGKMTIQIDVDKKGTVRSATSIDNTFPPSSKESMDKCILENIRTWHFNARIADQGAKVIYPFSFYKQK